VAATSSALLKKGTALVKSPLLFVAASAIKGKIPPLTFYPEFYMIKQLISFVNNKGKLNIGVSKSYILSLLGVCNVPCLSQKSNNFLDETG
jgi:hypothetical protein